MVDHQGRFVAEPERLAGGETGATQRHACFDEGAAAPCVWHESGYI